MREQETIRTRSTIEDGRAKLRARGSRVEGAQLHMAAAAPSPGFTTAPMGRIQLLHTGRNTLSTNFGRWARMLLLTGGIATAMALPGLVGTPLLPSNDGSAARVALAAPAMQDDDDGDGNDDPTNDNSDERNIEGQIIELYEGPTPPPALAGMDGGDGWALVGMVGGDVWVRIYNNQIHNSGVGKGDYVEMQGEYGERGVFDAYQVNVNDDDDNDND